MPQSFVAVGFLGGQVRPMTPSETQVAGVYDLPPLERVHRGALDEVGVGQ